MYRSYSSQSSDSLSGAISYLFTVSTTLKSSPTSSYMCRNASPEVHQEGNIFKEAYGAGTSGEVLRHIYEEVGEGFKVVDTVNKELIAPGLTHSLTHSLTHPPTHSLPALVP